MNKVKLYIDFDGVILDTVNYSYRLLLEEVGIDLFKQQRSENEDERITLFFKNLDWHELLMNSDEINDSFDNLKKLQSSSLYDVTVLTHVNTEKEANYKRKLLNAIVPDIPVITVPKEISKANSVPAYNTVLVDDYAENLKLWEERGGIGVKFSDANKPSVFMKVTSLDQLFDLYDVIKNRIIFAKTKVRK